MRTRVLLLSSLLCSALAAQKQASTLELLTRRPRAVALVEVAGSEERLGRVSVDLRTIEVLFGDLASEVRLEEHAHRHCGAACHGLERGARLVLFASVDRGRVSTLGGSRGLVHVGQGELAAIRALLAASDPLARIRVVAEQLGHSAPRVREDAALALPWMPMLERADEASRRRIRVALGRASHDEQLVGLLPAAARCAPDDAARVAWEVLVDGRRRGLHRFADGLLRESLPTTQVLQAIPDTSPLEKDARLRVVQALSAMRSQETRPFLERMLADAGSAVRIEAAAGLLELGTSVRVLASRLDARTVQQAQSLADQRRVAPPKLRAIRR